MLHTDLTNKILAACFEVSNELGAGFLEPVYQNALFYAINSKGINVEREYAIPVYFRYQVIGQYYADLFVEKKVIIEIKAVHELTEDHKAEVINYLKATGVDVGLLVNFGNSKFDYRMFESRFTK